jgi:hypothetical protein
MWIKLLIACLFLSGCANGGWSTEDSYRQAGVIALSGVDWMQTRKIAKNPDKYYEKNPLLGEHPSTEKVDVYFAASIAANTAIAMALPPEYRKWFQYVSIGVEAGVVANNFSIGLGVGF